MPLTSNDFENLTRPERMQTVAALFPSLRGKRGFDPWEPETILKWAWRSGGNEQAKTSARLLLTLWDPRRKWPWGRFDFIGALRTWDMAHLQAAGWYLQDYAHIEPPNKALQMRRRRKTAV